jgi:hypothetical protein
MTPKERAAELLLKELTSGSPEQWYYISMVHCPTNKFAGGFVVPGHGPTDAWMRFHALNLHEKDCETGTHGPIDEEPLTRIPLSMRLRKLSKEEAEKLGS